jgi:hypothetical protein
MKVKKKAMLPDFQSCNIRQTQLGLYADAKNAHTL